MNQDLALALFGLACMFALIGLVLRAKLSKPAKKSRRFYGSCVVALAALAFTGCGSMRTAMFKPTVEVRPESWATNTVPVLVTNLVTDPVTDQVSESIEVSHVAVVTHTPSSIVTNWTRTPESVATIQTVGAAVNTFAPGVGTAITFGLSALSTVWLGFLNRKNKRVSQSLVTGIEDARRAVLATGNVELDRKIVDVLQRHQAADGVAPAVAALVDRLTGYTRP